MRRQGRELLFKGQPGEVTVAASAAVRRSARRRRAPSRALHDGAEPGRQFHTMGGAARHKRCHWSTKIGLVMARTGDPTPSAITLARYQPSSARSVVRVLKFVCPLTWKVWKTVPPWTISTRAMGTRLDASISKSRKEDRKVLPGSAPCAFRKTRAPRLTKLRPSLRARTTLPAVRGSSPR